MARVEGVPARSQFRSVFKLRNFMVVSLSQTFSLFGDKLNYMALLAMIAFFFPARQSALAISHLSVVIALPVIIFGPFAGIFVDRWNRRRLMIGCDAIRMALVASIPFLMLRTRSITLIYFIVFWVFFLGLFFRTARLSIIPNLVARRRLLVANSFTSFLDRASTFAGILLGGMIVDWGIWQRIGLHGWGAGFYLDALTYLVSAGALSLVMINLRPRMVTQPVHASSVLGREAKRFWMELKEAYQIIRGSWAISFVFASLIILVLLGAAALVLFVPIVQTELRLGTRGVGFVGGIGSVGLLTSALAFGIWGHRLSKERVILGGIFLTGAITLLTAYVRGFLPLIPLAFLVGFLVSPIMIAQDTTLHETVPEELRGRVFSAKDWVLNLSFAVSAFLIGLLTIGIPVRWLLAGVGGLVSAASGFGFLLIRRKPTDQGESDNSKDPHHEDANNSLI